MAINLRTVSSKGAVANATATVTFGSTDGWNQGDLALLVLSTGGAYTSLSTPAGFVEVTGCRATTNGGANASGHCAIQVFYKYADGDSTAAIDANPVIAASGSFTTYALHMLSSSVWGSSPSFQPFDCIGNATYASSTTGNAPGATTRGANVQVFLGTAQAIVATTDQGSSYINASLNLVTNQAFEQTNLGTGGGFDTFTGQLATPGAYTASTFTLAAASRQAAFSLGLIETAPAQGIAPSVLAVPRELAPTRSIASVTVTRNDVDASVAAGLVGGIDPRSMVDGALSPLGMVDPDMAYIVPSTITGSATMATAADTVSATASDSIGGDATISAASATVASTASDPVGGVETSTTAAASVASAASDPVGGAASVSTAASVSADGSDSIGGAASVSTSAGTSADGSDPIDGAATATSSDATVSSSASGAIDAESTLTTDAAGATSSASDPVGGDASVSGGGTVSSDGTDPIGGDGAVSGDASATSAASDPVGGDGAVSGDASASGIAGDPVTGVATLVTTDAGVTSDGADPIGGDGAPTGGAGTSGTASDPIVGVGAVTTSARVAATGTTGGTPVGPSWHGNRVRSLLRVGLVRSALWRYHVRAAYGA